MGSSEMEKKVLQNIFFISQAKVKTKKASDHAENNTKFFFQEIEPQSISKVSDIILAATSKRIPVKDLSLLIKMLMVRQNNEAGNDEEASGFNEYKPHTLGTDILICFYIVLNEISGEDEFYEIAEEELPIVWQCTKYVGLNTIPSNVLLNFFGQSINDDDKTEISQESISHKDSDDFTVFVDVENIPWKKEDSAQDIKVDWKTSFKCTFCSYQFTEKFFLEDHIRVVHQKFKQYTKRGSKNKISGTYNQTVFEWMETYQNEKETSKYLYDSIKKICSALLGKAKPSFIQDLIATYDENFPFL